MELIKDPAREYRTVKEYVTHVLTNDDPYSAFNEKKRELMDDLGFD